jgi:prepilin-type N-terminal cleavage/methylation domain-containing protein
MTEPRSGSCTRFESARFSVTNQNQPCPIYCDQMSRKSKRQEALTMTELLCVIAITLILASLYLPTIARAYTRIRAFLGKM